MSVNQNYQLEIDFLESLNEELRGRVAEMSRVEEQSTRIIWPMYLVSGFLSFSAWTLSWIS